MRLQSPAFNYLASTLGSSILWPWMKSLRCDVHWYDETIVPTDTSDRFIFAFWHETILGAIRAGFGFLDHFSVIISRHRDGDLITQMVRRFGIDVVRGSTSRGGSAALRSMTRASQERHLLITPDGPRGPRRELQPGVVYLSELTGLPIVPVGIDFTRARRLSSWDRFALPIPGCKVHFVAGPPIWLPRELNDVTRLKWCNRIERTMLQATTLAAEFARGTSSQLDPRHRDLLNPIRRYSEDQSTRIAS